ncbi:MAG: nitronate monooxygenase [Candidatus Rokuibacteriota bacterium]|nr:MAG: nitronate monooxygenase [Candidatus Rokubacteria bacterium]
MIQTRFTALVGCSVPIQQAGMGLARHELAVAVARAGAMGMLGGVMQPPALLADEVESARKESGGPVGVNFLMPFLDRAAVEATAPRARLVEFSYGDPDADLVKIVRDAGALAAWQTGSGEEARAAEQAGCDFVIAQGVEAGGHVRGTTGLLPLLDEVLDAVDVPVVAAGGIGTERGMAAALAAGADAVRVGTRFLAAEEADVHAAYAEALVEAGPEDTQLTEAFSVMWPNAPHRVLSSCIEAAQGLEDEFVGEIDHAGDRMQVPRLSPPSPGRTATGRVDAMALYAGQSVGAIQRLQPAEAIVRDLAEGAERLLRKWGT